LRFALKVINLLVGLTAECIHRLNCLGIAFQLSIDFSQGSLKTGNFIRQVSGSCINAVDIRGDRQIVSAEVGQTAVLFIDARAEVSNRFFAGGALGR
jgi:hypothetical protein